MNAMTPKHEKWDEFYDRLCEYSGNCKCGTNKDYTKKLLKDFDVDIDASLKYFEDRSGKCDCEIIRSVEIGTATLSILEQSLWLPPTE